MIPRRFGIRYLLIATMAFAVVLAIYSAEKRRIDGYHNEQRKRLGPLISAVDAFIEQNDRCPTSAEFEVMADGFGGLNPIFNSGTNYVKKRGGVRKTDYILGMWDGDDNHCYRSWDERMYFNNNNNEIYKF